MASTVISNNTPGTHIIVTQLNSIVALPCVTCRISGPVGASFVQLCATDGTVMASFDVFDSNLVGATFADRMDDLVDNYLVGVGGGGGGGVASWSGGTTGMTPSTATTGAVVMSGRLAVGSGGTNSSTALTNGRLMQSSGGAIVEGTNASAPTFTSEALTATSNQLTLGAGTTMTLTAPTPAASRVITLPDGGSSATLAYTDAANEQQLTGDFNASGTFLLSRVGLIATASRTVYSTGTASQTGTTITGVGTTFTSAMVGGVFAPLAGTPRLIVAFVSTTQLTASSAQTIAAGAYNVIYGSLQAARDGYLNVQALRLQNLLSTSALATDANGFIVAGAAAGGNDTVFVKQVAGTGTAGGTFTSGAFRTRILDTTTTTPGYSGFLTLASNQMTFTAAGTYYISGSAPAYAVNQHTTMIIDVTAGSALLRGTSEMASAAGQCVTRSVILGSITPTVGNVHELQHRCATTRATDGFGVAASLATPEIYSVLQITKIA